MKSSTNAARISATVPEELMQYLESYRAKHNLSSRSEALSDAILALQELEMIRGYEELGAAQRAGQIRYPDLENTDGLDLEDATRWH
jgi:metal-responsive CopG/Arc/MetJ family transcriptional regulator